MARVRLVAPCVLTLVLASLACKPSGTTTQAEAAEGGDDEGDASTEPDTGEATGDLQARADALAHRFIILDGHVDAPMHATMAMHQGQPAPPVHAHTETDFDFERARAGGLDAPFMSIFTPADLESEPGASKAFAEQNIDFVHALVADHPDKFALAGTPEEVRANFERGLVSLPMGMENGSPIEGELANVRHFYERGIRYITLTHSKDNHICDSSYDEAHTHGGLSEFGESVVAEMNRVGIMVDVSHVSDDSFWEVLELSAVPVIASHSSCRHFTPGFERNMSDAMIRHLAEHGGVIQINFGGSFLSQSYREADDEASALLRAELEHAGLTWRDADARPIIDEFRATHPIDKVDVELVADHIDHVVELVGVDHVGFGSDFDGVGDSLPVGLSDVSMYPNLIAALLRRGYGEDDIEKMCSGNVLRVWQAVEDYAAQRR